MRFAETMFHDATCGPLVITEPTDVTEQRYVCLKCKQIWREAPITARIEGETRLVWDDDFLRGFVAWNYTDWFFLAECHLEGCEGDPHEEIIGGRLVGVCHQCGAVWEAEGVTE